ncbi:hypothetical protein C0993_011637, partial [Termitomyces sp. T159_Od127]
MVTVRDPKTNELFIDDSLTDVELSLISGTYVCHTGVPNQCSLRSWSSPMSTFETSGESYGRWNGCSEDVFLRHLSEINSAKHEANSRGPINAKEWRDLLRGNKE